jgi:proteasome lid subunit RPN8/RPN11
MMILILSQNILNEIRAHGESAYPNEGAGLLLGREQDARRVVEAILPLPNAREAEAQRRRYLLAPQDILHGEDEAARRGLDVIGVFHSHPDHPARPSEFDRAHALPWYSYVITSVEAGRAVQSRSWQLAKDRSCFIEEEIAG